MPMNFATYNGSSYKYKCNHSERYDLWNEDIRKKVVLENRKIHEINKNNGWHTPMMHMKVFLRRRKYYKFREEYLCDGLHATYELKQLWIKELSRALVLNLQKLV